ncbi:MAG TPA: tetratricopeptide repeat protein, partial [candidate division Zixibacteria bacterium]|nr:tetratricopeptide repeat protein [candidate division Zixibacteria bacterium]
MRKPSKVKKPPYVNAEAQAFVQAAMEFSLERDMESALECIQSALEILPTDPQLLYLSGSAKYMIGDDEGAVEDLDRTIELDHKNVSAYTYRGMAKIGLGQHWEGIKDLNTAIRLDPKNHLAYFHRADAYQYNKKGEIFGPGSELGKAIADYDWAIKLNPKNPDYWYCRGRAKAHLEGFKPEIILSDYEKALELDKNHARAYFGIGTYKAEQGEYAEAIENLTKSIDLDSTFPLAVSNRGMAKKLSGDYEGALIDFDKAIEMEPDNALFWFHRGSLKGCIDRIPYEEEIADLNKALELTPDEPEIYFIRGMAKWNHRRYAEAIEDFEKELEFRQNNSSTFYYLANSKGKIGKYTIEERLRDYDRAAELECEIPDCYIERGFLRLELKQYPGALEDAHRFLKLRTNDLLGFVMEIRVDYNTGNPKFALKAIDKALAIDPTYEWGLK